MPDWIAKYLAFKWLALEATADGDLINAAWAIEFTR